MSTKVETLIIGGGQAGLAVSYHLSQRGHEHLVLEKDAQAGSAWRNDRWDSFTLNTPNWAFRLPGAEYQGDMPDAFMERPEIITRFEEYVQRFDLPVHYGAAATAVEQQSANGRYLVHTAEASFEAANVVIATGLFQQPKRPADAAALSPHITQLAASQYRRPEALPPGAVLVVGSGQSGCQIAEELYKNGRRVFLCTGGAGRAPRRYRGRDIVTWLDLSGFFARPAESLPTPRAKFAALPQVTGNNGGHNLNLHQFCRDGVTLLGHWQGGSDNTLHFAPDLHENLAKGDAVEAQLLRMIDEYIARAGLDAPAEEWVELRDGYAVEPLTTAGVLQSGITTILWSVGFSHDYSLVKLPVVDSDGYPLQHKGITSFPGLFFAGLPWLDGVKSGLLLGVGDQAAIIAAAIAAR